MIQDAKAVTQITVSFSLTRPALEQREPTYISMHGSTHLALHCISNAQTYLIAPLVRDLGMVSKSLEIKLARQKALAVNFVPQMRLCGAVVALVATDQDKATAVAELKTGLGSNWSPVTALQFMSGSQAKFAAECCEGVEREQMLAAHSYALQLIEVSISENLSLSAIIKAVNQR